MCLILNLDAFRPVPTVQKQKEKRDEIVRRKVIELYNNDHWLLVAKACDAASTALANGRSYEEALEAAFMCVYLERRKGDIRSMFESANE